MVGTGERGKDESGPAGHQAPPPFLQTTRLGKEQEKEDPRSSCGRAPGKNCRGGECECWAEEEEEEAWVARRTAEKEDESCWCLPRT